MAAPKEVKSLVINTAGWATTEAESNHKAFTYYDQLGVLALPVNNQSVASQSSFSLSSASIMVFDVKNTPAIVARGTIDLTPSTGLKTNLLAQRSLFMEDYLYGFSNLGMKIRKMTDLTKDVSAVVFPQ